ncbi:ATP-dependent RNA helicase dbp7 [Neophaeococcomyces mojaviensis]|uniref:ATP-dependent RNA helicase dbp7 n=1 Tax=Neophaeococcomyces mojaviensis TaxID=3383035 RepID=A0ACC3A2C9_9EURO|nr:ATP-dependent RNA helicase dbp7 [Knufia sp. JES_112]
MADSGLLLNFAAGEVALPSSALKFKGGSWKERARLAKSAKNPRGLQKPQSQQSARAQVLQRAVRDRSPDYGEQQAGLPPTKRRRIDSRHGTTHVNKGRAIHLEGATYGGQPGNREVISSLFSYNPEATTEEEQPKGAEETTEPVKPSNAPLPDGIDTFTSLGLADSIAAHLLTKMSLKNPTAIQRATLSQLTKEDEDVFIQSETGSGKTLAYLLPIVQRLLTMAERQKHESTVEDALHRDSGLFAIVIAPTRELCKQISVVLERLLGCAHFIVAGTVIGGEKKKSEKARLRKGLNILVATPGRLVDHLDNTKNLDVSKVRYLVLDEGDRLMDLGFEEDITKIVRTLDEKRRPCDKPGLPDKRITILCSATLKANVEKLGDISLKDAVLVKGEKEDADGETAQVGGDSAFLAPAQLKQSYIVCAAKLRLVTLAALLKKTFARKGSVMKAIVFLSCADSVEFHHRVFTRQTKDKDAQPDEEPAANKPSDSSFSEAISPSSLLSSSNNPLTVHKLHGSLPQQSRTAILKSFATSTTASLLLATDVASRGLDLPNLDLVIEYDPAFSKDDHLHRIGRTARLGRDGRAIIFLMPGSEEGYIQILRDSYRTSTDKSTNVTSNTANDILKKGFTANSGVVSKGGDWEKAATEFQLDVERWVLADAKVKELTKNAFQSHIRAYATHIASERKYFDIKELHLGHLAKAFGLRDPPGKVNVVGLRGKSGNGKPRANEARKRVAGGFGEKAEGEKRNAAEVDETGDAEAAAERMRYLVRNRKKMMGAGADEFNIA